jgi:hypothetical protein
VGDLPVVEDTVRSIRDMISGRELTLDERWVRRWAPSARGWDAATGGTVVAGGCGADEGRNAR